jgi:hypothetical protein
MLGRRQDEPTPWVDAASRTRSAIQAWSSEIQLDAVSIAPILRGGLAAFPEDGNDALTLLDRAIAAAAQAGDVAPVMHQVPEHQAICRALIELSKGLGLKVLAEGTESEEEVRYLVDHGCHLFQGYYFSRPVPGREFAGLLESPLRFALPAAERDHVALPAFERLSQMGSI